jgi:hypothetical protein
MKKITAALFLLLASVLANAQTKTKTYQGAWFDINYPATFKAKGSLKSLSNSKGFDSAIFTSPDGTVSFYVFSPQWNGQYPDIAIRPNETLSSEKTLPGDSNKVVRYWTIVANDRSYVRTYEETASTLYNTVRVLGIQYKTQAAYDKYKTAYLAFKKSLIQYAD